MQGADQREREAFEVTQTLDLLADAACIVSVIGGFRRFRKQFVLESTKAALPSLRAADHRGVDQQLLPTDGSLQSARHDSVLVCGIVLGFCLRVRRRITKEGP